jgi:hypothetical protein
MGQLYSLYIIGLGRVAGRKLYRGYFLGQTKSCKTVKSDSNVHRRSLERPKYWDASRSDGFVDVSERGISWSESGSVRLLFPIPSLKALENGRPEKCVPLVDFPNRVAHVASRGLLDEIWCPGSA